MAGLIGSEGTPFSITFNNPDATTLGLMVGRLCASRAEWSVRANRLPTAVYEIGCFFGAVFSFAWGENYSRRACMIAGVVVMLVGAILQTVSHTMAQLIAGRVITGLVSSRNMLSTCSDTDW